MRSFRSARQLRKRLCSFQGWQNVQALHIKTASSVALPVFNSVPRQMLKVDALWVDMVRFRSVRNHRAFYEWQCFQSQIARKERVGGTTWYINFWNGEVGLREDLLVRDNHRFSWTRSPEHFSDAKWIQRFQQRCSVCEHNRLNTWSILQYRSYRGCLLI